MTAAGRRVAVTSAKILRPRKVATRMPRPLPKTLSVALAGSLAIAAAGALSGCGVLGAAAYKLSGPTQHPPAFALGTEPTVVIVGRQDNFGAIAVDGQRIAQSVTVAIKAMKIPPPVIEAPVAAEARTRATMDGKKLSPSQLATTVGAKQMIYVDLKRYDSAQSFSGETADGRAEASVWVVDATTAQPKWPPEANQGFPVTATVPSTPMASGVDEQTVRDKLNAELSLKIARLFTGWTEE